MKQEIYYKATKSHGVSGQDPNFIYHIGVNKHPNPDRKSKDACGIGIHLAKTIEAAKRYVRDWSEIYEAKAGKILGENSNKVRCTSCELIRIIERKRKDVVFPNKPCLCEEWINEHWNDISQLEIDNQTLSIGNNGTTINIKQKAKKKDIKYLVKEAVKVDISS